MKINEAKNIIKTNSTSSESHEFSIGDVSTIIEILRNRLYSKPIQTLTQEYMCNARDAHREAERNGIANASQRPIQVTLPTELESVIKFRDFGVGLSKERVKEVFVKYGVSTKRSDNLETGGFGLGAKSAWAYTDSFVVVSYYNGICSTYIAHTGNNKNGTFELVSEESTSEPNGIEVQVPVKTSDIYKFKNAVYRTAMFWKVKPELKGIANVEIPEEFSKNSSVTFEQDGIIVTDQSDFIRSIYNCSYHDKLFVLVDDIPYNISKFSYEIDEVRNIHDVVRNGYTFIHIENGAVDVAASREEVGNDDNNKNKIRVFCNNAMSKFRDIAENELKKEFNFLHEFENACNRLSDTFTLSSITNLDLTYSNEGLDFQFNYAGRYKTSALTNIRKIEEDKRRDRSYFTIKDVSEINYHESNGGYVILLEDKEFSKILQKRKAKKFFEQGIQRVYLANYDESNKDALQKIAGAKLISEVQHDKIGGRSGRLKGDDEIILRYLVSDGSRSYNHKVSSSSNEHYNIKDFFEDTEITYYAVPFGSSLDAEDNKYNKIVRFLNGEQNCRIVRLSKKDYEKAMELDCFYSYDELIENFAEHFPVDDETIEKFVYSRSNMNLIKLKKFDDKITCPIVKKLIAMYPEFDIDSASRRMSRCERTRFIYETFYSHYKVASEKMAKVSEEEEKVCNLYPLLNGYVRDYDDSLSEYVYYINEKSKVIREISNESGKIKLRLKNK